MLAMEECLLFDMCEMQCDIDTVEDCTKWLVAIMGLCWPSVTCFIFTSAGYTSFRVWFMQAILVSTKANQFYIIE